MKLKKTEGKKGFTLVELVIVIAVIAVLAAVLIPTFSTVINKANQSADVQTARTMSTIAKAGAINGAYDESGRVYDMNYVPDVVAYLKSQNFELTPKSKDTSFWYNRATGDVSIAKDSDMFFAIGEGASASFDGFQNYALSGNQLGDPDATFTQDCPEALVASMPNMVFIDQDSTNPVTQAINTIYNLVPTTGTYEEKTAAMATAFATAVENNEALKKLFNVKAGATPSASYNYLVNNYQPANCYYISNDGGYTADTTSKTLNAAVVQAGTTTIGKFQGDSAQSITFASNVVVNVPSSVTTFADGAFSSFDSKATIVVNNNYDSETLKKLGTAATVVNNTGTTQIAYKTLRFGAFNYTQYGQRYTNASGNTVYSLNQSFTSGETVSSASLATLAGSTVNSVFAIPQINLFSPDESGMLAWDESESGTNKMTFDVRIYQKNISNLTVFYGSVVDSTMTYKIQDIAYIKYLSTYTIKQNDVNYLYVGDPTSGSYYYNLDGIKLYAVVNGSEIELIKSTDRTTKGDYYLNVPNAVVSKIIVKDSNGKEILVQY